MRALPQRQSKPRARYASSLAPAAFRVMEPLQTMPRIVRGSPIVTVSYPRVAIAFFLLTPGCAASNDGCRYNYTAQMKVPPKHARYRRSLTEKLAIVRE